MQCFCPLHINKWNHVDTKQDLWEYTLDKYNIPNAEQRWVLDGIQSAWRKYKNHLYRKHFKHFDNDDLRLANKPDDVSEYAFKDLLKYWHSNEFKKMSETNIKNRQKLKNPHTVGDISFAVICDQLAKMEKVQSDKQSEDGSQSVDTCATIMGPEYSGFVRLYGRGFTKTALKWKGYLEPSASTSNEM